MVLLKTKPKFKIGDKVKFLDRSIAYQGRYSSGLAAGTVGIVVRVEENLGMGETYYEIELNGKLAPYMYGEGWFEDNMDWNTYGFLPD